MVHHYTHHGVSNGGLFNYRCCNLHLQCILLQGAIYSWCILLKDAYEYLDVILLQNKRFHSVLIHILQENINYTSYYIFNTYDMIYGVLAGINSYS